MKNRRLLSYIISSDEKKRSEAFGYIYKKMYGKIKSYLLKHSATTEEIEDLFQEAVFTLYKNIQTGTFKNKSQVSTYLFSICKNLWFTRYKKRSAEEIITSEMSLDAHPADINENTVDKILINRVLSDLSPSCKQLLIDYYFKKIAITEIKEKEGLGSIQAVKNKKWRCMKKLQEIIEKYDLTQENFYR